MTLRVKVLASSLGLTVAAMVVLGVLLFRAHRATYLEEAELRARAFLSLLAVAATAPLAEGRIEDLDGMLSRLIECNLEGLDIRFVAVLDTEGRVVGHTDSRLYGHRTTQGFYGEALQANRPLVREEDDTLLVSTPISTAVFGQPGIRWGTAVAGVGLERVRAGLWALFFRAVLMVLVVVAVATVIMAARLERLVLRPVRRLTQATRAFASGDMGARAEAVGDDELADLGETFNQMATRIGAQTEWLEEEVRVRTRDLEEANRRLEALAVTDPLTGLHNRRYFEEALPLEVKRAQRMATPVSLLMMDVDYFKAYNDTHGHPAGDEILRTIGRLVRERVRSTDVPCRYGGEEFAVILPGTSRTDALTLANDLRLIVEAHAFPHEETQPQGRLTISIGVATYPTDASDEVALVRAADQALYRAKERGRNRVEAAAGD